MSHRFHAEALEQYEEAAQYYASKQADLDLRFINSIQDAIRLILEDPLRWRAFYGDIHRCFTRVFPYAILYAVEPDFVLIVAVAHCSRNPGYWRHRITNSR